jgi:hypothetical protein
MAKFCFCGQPVFGKGFCKAHQHMRPDYDNRTIAQRAMDKQKNDSAIAKVRTLPHIKGEEKEMIDGRNSLIQDLDTIVSLYVRHRDADEEGNILCYTCGKEVTIATADASHYISRRCLITRFDARNNIRSCCKGCNQFLSGNLSIFKKKLEEEQKGLSEYLEEISREMYKPSNNELFHILLDFRKKFKLIEKKNISSE